ncbi:adenosine deaminase [soil metagenome]
MAFTPPRTNMAHPVPLDLLASLPKVDLHFHMAGTLRPPTLAQLADKHGLPLPRSTDALYQYKDFYDFIDVLRLVGRSIRDASDFERVAYEAIEDAASTSNARHLEMSFNPQYFKGVAYRTQLEGLSEGIAAARRDFGVSTLLIASLDRELSQQSAEETIDDVLANRHELVVGVGLDGPEHAGPPAQFESLFARVGQAGLMRTAHACEDNQTLEQAPPLHVHQCLNLLRCDRLDHGYNLLADDAAVDEARARGTCFCVCSITSVTRNRARRLDAIERMKQAGLQLTVNTDDPAMFHTNLAHSYATVLEGCHWGWEEAKAFSLAGLEASWLDPLAKNVMRDEFRQQIAELDARYQASVTDSSADTSRGTP